MPREPVDRQRIERFLRELGKRFRRPGRVYLVGGTTMVYEGFRTALSKIERGTEEDYADVLALLRSGRVDAGQLRSSFEQILPDFETASLRGDADEFQRKFDALMEMWAEEDTR